MASELAVIEAEYQEQPTRALTLADTAGTFALASMSDTEFTTRLAALRKGRDRVAAIQRELMDKDVDFGTIPGTPKPTLLKPGAEKICDIYSLRADFHPERLVGDNVTAPALAYQTRCELHLGSLEGPVVAVGYGSANSWERKHRYRKAERACPECGVVGALLRSKQGKAEWFCWAKKGGCGKTFALNDARVTEQPLGEVENPDPWDLDTTLLKMAEKRAHVDATLRGTATSGLFTQDVEDLPQAPVDEQPPPPEPSMRERVDARRARTDAAGPVPAPAGEAPTPGGTDSPAATDTASPGAQGEGAPVPAPSPDTICGALPPADSPLGLTQPCNAPLSTHGRLHKSAEGSWPR